MLFSSRWAPLIIVSPTVFGILLSGCSQEAPELQMVRAELQLTQQRLDETIKQGYTRQSSPQDKEAIERYPALRSENEELKRKLALLDDELEKSKATSFRVLEENELFGSLERSASPLHDQVRSEYRIDAAGVKELQRPDPSKPPYSCILFLEVTRRSDNQPLEAAIPAQADWHGHWTFPELSKLVAALKPRGFYARPSAPGADGPRGGAGTPTPPVQPPRTVDAPEAIPRSTPPAVPDVVYKKRFNWGD
jgi:hypothetical protein